MMLKILYISLLLAATVSADAGYKNIKEFPIVKPEPEALQVIKDEKNEFSFLIESSEDSFICIKPSKFKITKGKNYFIDNTSEHPHIEITAEKDGEIAFTMPKMERAGVSISEVMSGNLLADGSFEQKKGWSFTSLTSMKAFKTYGFDIENIFKALPSENTKADRFEFSNRFKHTGTLSIMLEKNSKDTLISLKSERINVEAGNKYYLTAFYYPEKFDINTGFSISIRLFADGKSVNYVTARHWLSFPAFYTEPGKWRYTFDSIDIPANYKDKKLEVEICIEIDGAPGRIYWDDIDFRIAPVLAKQPGKEIHESPVITIEKLNEKIKNMDNSQARIVKHGEIPVIEINGKTEPCYIFHGAMYEQGYKSVLTARETGIKIVIIEAHLNFWGDVKNSAWKGKDAYDFSIIENNIKKALSYYPDAKIILAFEYVYNNFAEDYPESAWVTGEGKTDVRVNPPGKIKKTSHISDSVRREVGKTYRKIGEFLRDNDVGKCVIGMHMCFGDDGQWYPDRPWSLKTFDYSEGSRKGLILELRKMYNNDIDALRKAWGNPAIKFEDVIMPSAAELSPEKYFLSPANGPERRLIDCVEAYHGAVVETMNMLGSEFKEGIGKPVLVFTYFPDNSIMTKAKLLHSQVIDGIIAVPGYLRNRMAGSHNESFHAHGSFRIHGKIYMDEVDFRSEYGAIVDRFYRRYVGASGGLEDHFNQMRRNFAFLYSQGEWGWLRTIGNKGHFVWYGKYLPVLKEIQRAAEFSLTNKDEHDWGQIAVFRDDLFQAYYSSFEKRDHFLNHASVSVRGLAHSGLTWNTYLVEDIDNSLRPPAKINYFSSGTTISLKQVEWIEKNLQKDGNVLIFAGDAGRTAAGGFETNIKRLTGITVESHPEIEVSYNYSPDRFDDTLSTGNPGNALWIRSMKGPLYLVKDQSVNTLAFLEGTKLPGIAVKRHKDWTAIYIAGGCEQALTAEFIRAVAGEAKIKPIGPLGDITYAGNGFLAIHAVKPGSKTLNLKAPADLLDITSNSIVARNVASYTLEMKFGETRWFRAFYKK